MMVYPITNSFSKIVAGHPADDATENAADDSANGGKRVRDTRCGLVIVHQNPFPFACFSYAS